jgi:Sulfotransferase domain
MKVIGAGLPRTGTLSQKIALEVLGFGPCYHMVNVLADLPLAEQWSRAMDGDQDWHEIFGDHQSTVDWPGSYFYRELAAAYPDAKIVLSARDPEAWEKSMRDTIWDLFNGDSPMTHISRAREIVDPEWRAYLMLMQRMWAAAGIFTQGRLEPGHFAAYIARYEERVKRDIPGDRLLVWSVTEGWEPLCEFLEVDVPDIPFPRLNDSRTFIDRVVDASLRVLQEWRARELAPEEPAGQPA